MIYDPCDPAHYSPSRCLHKVASEAVEEGISLGWGGVKALTRVFCPQCQEVKQTSHVYVGAQMSTALHAPDYYDEQGVWHPGGNPNTITTRYTCSNGHTWEEKRKADE